ncbi:MAG: hypothetical protein U5M50_16105 [Sphingobium sp.]|nr:hypothetical protein [Sphingobium sp.]
MPSIQSYVHPIYLDRRDFDPDVEDPEHVEYGMKWPINHDTLSPRDEQYLLFQEGHRGNASVNAIYALKKAIAEAGLSAGNLGSDDPRVGPWLQEIGLPDVQVSDATTTFRDIRMVKSPDEIALMRKVALMNQEALDVVLDLIDVGMPRDELDLIYNRRSRQTRWQGDLPQHRPERHAPCHGYRAGGGEHHLRRIMRI